MPMDHQNTLYIPYDNQTFIMSWTIVICLPIIIFAVKGVLVQEGVSTDVVTDPSV